MNSQDNGADVKALQPKPRINLSELVNLLSESIQTKDTDSLEQKALSFDSDTNGVRLKFSTSKVLRRLFRHKDCLNKFDPSKGENSGFVENLKMPPLGQRYRLGCNITDKTDLNKAVKNLITAIEYEIDSVIPEGSSLSSLLLDNPAEQLKELASKVGTNFNNGINESSLKPLVFQSEDVKNKNEQETIIAKVFCATEVINADDYFEQMKTAVANHLAQERHCDDDEIEAACQALEAEQEKLDSQVNRFLKFLEDDALARIRLTISFEIMKAIADNAKKKDDHELLGKYIKRAISFVEMTRDVNFDVDLTAHYGHAADCNLFQQLNKATFYSCLPVWAEASTQLSEDRNKNQQHGYALKREISYRFRVNGNNPELNKSAFEGRLDQIKETLLPDENSKSPTQFISSRLAELIFLAIVIPDQNEESYSKNEFVNKIELLIEKIKAKGKIAISEVLEDLRRRSKNMDLISKKMIEVLREKGPKIISQVQKKSNQQYICVKESIIEWPRLEGAESGTRDLLKRSNQYSDEKVEWFKNIEICDRPETPGLLFSIKVNTEISEQNLITNGDSTTLKVKRFFPERILQVLWIPEESGEEVTLAKEWFLDSSINISYELRTLQHKTKNDPAEEEKNKHYHATSVAGFALLIYCFLWIVIKRLGISEQQESIEFTTLMLRLQKSGKNLEKTCGDSYVYAAAQAIEQMLAQDIPIRMQGIVLDNLKKNNKNLRFIKQGIFNALPASFPLVVNQENTSTAPTIGLISYTTRPGDGLTLMRKGERQSFLMLTQSYIARVCSEPISGYQIRAERMQSDILSSFDSLKKQRLIKEEIAHLKKSGCKHIILLSHLYGERHTNRLAEHNSLLTSTGFLETVYRDFPDITVYPMERDVFPALRIYNRGPNESAFEIIRSSDHNNFLRGSKHNNNSKSALIPVYTFATLFVVGKSDDRPQSGFCVYFLKSVEDLSTNNWTEKAYQNFIYPVKESSVHSCLISVLRGLHYIESERGVKVGQFLPVLDPFNWISPKTTEAFGEVKILDSRRKGDVILSYPALLTHIADVLHGKRK
jgi:hypothetical protein